MRVWKDSPQVATDPNQLVTETSDVRSKDGLRLTIAVDGGFVAELKPK
jgi:hypothetical protein